MIELIPAIDIIDGKCVRLTKGDYDAKTVYSDSPADVAVRLEEAGFKRLHVVDLDGAKSKHVVNLQALKDITSRTGLVVDFGGGVKTEEDISKVFGCGAAMVTVGSIAVTEKDLFVKWLEKFGAARIILGADVRDIEGAAIAHAACAADVPVWAFKAISDNAGEKSIREYSENLQIALAALGEKLPDIFAEVNNG